MACKRNGASNSMGKPLVRPVRLEDLKRLGRSGSMILLKWLDDRLVGGSNVRRLSKPSPLQVGLRVTASTMWCSFPNGDGKRSSGISAVNWNRFSMRCETEGMLDRGGALNAGSCAHVHRDPAQAPGAFRDWIPEGKERDCHSTAFPERRGISPANTSGPAATRCPR
jgi:hypothetical protein